MLNYSIDSNLSQVRELSGVLHGFCEKHEFSEILTGQLELILVEAVNNVIEHAYQNKEGLPIDATFETDSTEVKITIMDRGIAILEPLHETEGAMPDIGELPEGGWGIALIHSLADRVEHFRENGSNTLVISKQIN